MGQYLCADMADLVTYAFSPPLNLDNHNVFLIWAAPYRIAGKFGESSVIRQTKTIQILLIKTHDSESRGQEEAQQCDH